MYFMSYSIKTNSRENILKLQFEDEWYNEGKYAFENEVMQIPKFEGYILDDDGLLQFNGRIYILPNEEIHHLILREAHRAVYMAHSRDKNT
jgi:hypothetical protein